MTDTVVRVAAAPDLEAGSVLLTELCEQVRTANAATARAVLAAGELAGSGVAERVEGLPLDLVLATACRLTGADRGSLLTAGETLRTMPATARLFTDGVLSWGQVRRIVAAARRVPVERRGIVDARIAATCQAHGGLDAFNPDDLCEQVEVACEELRNPRTVERAEQRKARGEFVSVQSDFDGGATIYANLGPVSAAIFLNALTAQLAAMTATDDSDEDGNGDGDGDDGTDTDADGDGDADGGGVQPGVWTGKDRSRRLAHALVTLATASLAGVFASGKPRPAKPLYVVHIPTDRVTRTAAGIVELDVPGPLPTLTARLVEALSADADLQAVIFDGHRPLAVSRKLHATHTPDDVRTAVAARDLGSRFPGSSQPITRCHIHHLRHREHGGDNDVDNLAALGAHEHLTGVHKRGWQGRMDPDTGMLTWTRRGKTLRTLPRHTPLARPPDPTPTAQQSWRRAWRGPLRRPLQ
jgi:hypothetical protein